MMKKNWWLLPKAEKQERAAEYCRNILQENAQSGVRCFTNDGLRAILTIIEIRAYQKN